MKYKNSYESIIKNIVVPNIIDDNYIKGMLKFQKVAGDYTLEYIWGFSGKDLGKTNFDGLSKDNFTKISFDENTVFSKKQNEKYNPTLLLEKGKKFGLGLDKLHTIGLDGNGVNIAIIDTSFDSNNFEMLDNSGKSKIILYDDSRVDKKNKNIDGFHGKAVTSLLLGTSIGVAPNCSVYYFAFNEGEYTDEVLSNIIEQIKTLNEKGANISAVSLSTHFKDQRLNEKYTKELEKQNCAFISSPNFFKHGFNYMCRNNYKDIDDSNNFELENSVERDFSKNTFLKDFESVKKTFEENENKIKNLEAQITEKNGNDSLLDELNLLKKEQDKIKPFLSMNFEEFIKLRKAVEQESIYIPCGGRTYQQIGRDGKYMYCGHASASWSIPQVTGLFAISRQLDPLLTFEEFTEISKVTATLNNKGYLVINPESMVREINNRNIVKYNNTNFQTISEKYINNLDIIVKSDFYISLKKMTNTDELSYTTNKKSCKDLDITR